MCYTNDQDKHRRRSGVSRTNVSGHKRPRSATSGPFALAYRYPSSAPAIARDSTAD